MKGNYQYIIESIEGPVGRITLHRPEVHNAMHIEMIRELTLAITKLSSLSEIRVILFDSSGENFSAGADLKWMKQGLEQTEQEVKDESKELALLFNQIFNCRKVTLAIATGKVMGGANGIIAATDIAVANENTSFAFTEVRLGLIPATIAPYIAWRSGKAVAREWMLSARPIDAKEALQKGLLNFVLPPAEIDDFTDSLVKRILLNGPKALEGVKDLFRDSTLDQHPDDLIEKTAEQIAFYRTSDEGQEGIRSFFEKKQPSWNNE